MDVEKFNQIVDDLDCIRFFNDRAGRELWQDKTREVQNRDIESTENKLKNAIDYIFELFDKNKELEEEINEILQKMGYKDYEEYINYNRSLVK